MRERRLHHSDAPLKRDGTNGAAHGRAAGSCRRASSCCRRWCSRGQHCRQRHVDASSGCGTHALQHLNAAAAAHQQRGAIRRYDQHEHGVINLLHDASDAPRCFEDVVRFAAKLEADPR